MRYKNYILSKGDRVKLKADGKGWSHNMTKKYGGKIVTIKEFLYDRGFECEPLRGDILGYWFSLDDIDEVVYRKNNEEKIDKIKKDEIKKGLECCAAVGSETSYSDCSYVYRCKDLNREALCIITEQEKEIEQLTRKCNQQAEKLKLLDDFICKNFAELEDKIEDGTLIELPYKLGTKLYFIVLHTFGGYFEIFETELWVYVSRYKDEFGGVDFAIEINDVDFDNETWVTAHCYSTKAEAEAKLKELQEIEK